MKINFKILLFLISLNLFLSCNKNKKINHIDLDDEIPQKIINKNALIYFDKGEEFLNEAKFDSAILNFKKSSSYEKNTLTFNQIGNCEAHLKNVDRAIEFHKLGILADSTYYTNYLNIARCYIAKNELDNSEKYLLKIITINSSEYSVSLANLYLVIVYFNQNRDCETVLKQFQKAETLKNDYKTEDFYELIEKKIEKRCK